MPEIADNILLDKLRMEENDAYNLLYKAHFPSTANYIKKNSGNDQDAEDIFQESILVLLDKLRRPDFILTSSLKTYLFSISKNLWLKKIRSKKGFIIGITVDEIETINFDSEANQNCKEEKLATWLDKITANCQRILKAIFFLNEPMDRLMLKMGWKNKHTASNQKYKCIEQIRKESGNKF
ncbi:sigma-70 family RNA polymerase sigma factor [Niastella caeni]|uniref:Sigma-70 family RNA polymerase sigma factor n=1 Tax=Niastella caeni TaxID=2569763 RepID=A0A4S8HKX0_9BACT|nr:sigma-70 family RNA polymerase sigma factor [Niastella caeni]THU35803.1 sigma-70 family RNA polymerase sigma factor [Niastella caeni]